MDHHPKIILGVTGGIAAYKSAELIRKLKENGATVRVVMTEAAKAFITPLTLQALSGEAVHEALLDPSAEQAMSHIALARWADWILVAPASADFIARLAHGHANDLLTTLCLASDAPIILAPAMNRLMWENAATQANIDIIRQRGIDYWGPDEGEQACGEVGVGRMMDPEVIAKKFMARCQNVPQLLKNKKVLITAGPTQEAIDPVRYITNKSSGKMGYALAEAALALGAKVILISGPVKEKCHSAIHCVSVKTAEAMLSSVSDYINDADIFIATAAVADYRVNQVSDQKLKKSSETWDLHLIKNPDILSMVAALPHPPFVVGFAAETQNLVEGARQKLIAKKADMMLANDVSQSGIGFDADDNEVIAITRQTEKNFPRANKKILAKQLIQFIIEKYHEKNST